MSVSARALKVCMHFPDPFLSFERIHEINKRAVPIAIMKYNLSIQLYKLSNSKDHSLEWFHLNNDQIITSRQRHFVIMKSNRLKVSLNALTNRLHTLNGKI